MLTADEARELWRYDPETGDLWWRNPTGGRPADKPAGSINRQGYRRLAWKGKNYAGHHVVWLIEYGEWPAQCLDHLNGVRNDNRLENLREVTRSQNSWNQGVRKNSRSGLKGVSWITQCRKWRATIGVNYKRIHIGDYNCKYEAYAAYCDAADKYHGEHANYG